MMSGIQPPENARGSTYGAVIASEGEFDMNSITIDGIITYPPVRVPSESSLFAKFSIKSTAAENTLLMRVRCYEELAERVINSCYQGMSVRISGHLVPFFADVEIVANSVQSLPA